jgi:hypothetical protein
MRVAEECGLLENSETITIADTSFWSLLMEVNQAITLRTHHPNDYLNSAIERLIDRGSFLNTITNPNIIAMSKHGEAHTLHPNISDREAWGRILDAGEYSAPEPIAAALQGSFGIERRGFTERERSQIQDTYEKHIGVIYYKPHDWSRAYRIETQINTLQSDGKLAPLLAAVFRHTLTRSIVEPWPQFLADYTAKQISSIAALYGRQNHHRAPFETTRT